LSGGFAGDVFLRMAEDGTLYQYDPDPKTEKVRVSFGTPPGGSYETAIDPCSGRAEVVANDGTYKGPIGELGNVFEVRYPPAQCADAGLERQQYGRWIGLLRTEETTIAGPRAFDLIYARIGGVTVVSAPEVSFTLTLDKATYDAPEMVVRLTLRNTQPEPLKLVFPSGQRYDIVIRDSKRNKVYQWSASRSFVLAFGEMSVSNEVNWVEVIRPTGVKGGALPAGSYTAEAWLTTEGKRRYLAKVGFETAKPE